MSDNEDTNVAPLAFNFDDWANSLGLKRPVTQTLRNEELVTKEALILLESKDLKELGLTMGSVKMIMNDINKWKCVPIIEEKDENAELLEGAGKTFDHLLSDPTAPSPKHATSVFARWTRGLFSQLSPRRKRLSISLSFSLRRANGADKAGARNSFLSPAVRMLKPLCSRPTRNIHT